jgi:lipopolysaccharide transport protein LptA
MRLVALALLLVTEPPATPTPPKPSVADALALDKQGPLDFRCDAMQVLTKPNRTVCTGNVVVRRVDLTVCCDKFEGTADDKWQWQKLVCVDDVRARRGEETMWSDRAEFSPTSNDLVLTGRPIVKRGQSVIEGQRITVNVKDDRARVTNPRGRLETSELEAAKGNQPPPPTDMTKPVPTTCPVAGRRP